MSPFHEHPASLECRDADAALAGSGGTRPSARDEPSEDDRPAAAAPSSFARRAEQALTTLAFRTACGVFSLLPRRLSMALARALGAGLSFVMPRRRRIARENVAATIGREMTPAERRRLVRRSFGCSAAMAMDLLTLGRVAAQPRRWCEVSPESLEVLRRIESEGRGALMVAGHFGLFESMGMLLGHLGCRLSFVSKPFGNPALDALVDARRGATGNRVLHKGGASERVRARVADGECVALVIDQHVGPHDRDWVPFLGLPAATTRLLGRLAVETGAPLVPIHSFPLPAGRCRIEVGPILDAPSTGDPARDGHAVVEAAVRELERAVERQPEAWMWVHRRWKVHPDGESARYPSYSESESAEARRKAGGATA